MRICSDGVEKNFEFLRSDDAQYAGRYLDLTEHTWYPSGVLRQTVEQVMASEALVLRPYDDARMAIKNMVEMPDRMRPANTC